MTRMIFAAVFALTSLVFGPLPAAAYEAPWCAVLGMGKGVYWDCQYATFEACRPNVLAGNRGWCNPNPYFVASNVPTEGKHHHQRRTHLQ
jgi:hypothetical protein